MRIQVNEFKYIPGENDAEYIKLLKGALARQQQITSKAIAKIKAMIKSGQMWTPVSEGLPEETGSYICTCSGGTPYQKVTVIKFHPRTKAWELTGTRAYWKVRAWMPLPDPYKEDEK